VNDLSGARSYKRSGVNLIDSAFSLETFAFPRQRSAEAELRSRTTEVWHEWSAAVERQKSATIQMQQTCQGRSLSSRSFKKRRSAIHNFA
jgi:hypothetical protein